MSKTDFSEYEGRTYDEALEFLTAHRRDSIAIAYRTVLERESDRNGAFIVVTLRGTPIIEYRKDGSVLILATSHEYAETLRERLNVYTPAAFAYRNGLILRCLFRIDYDAATKSMHKNYLLANGRTVPCNAFVGMNVGPVYGK